VEATPEVMERAVEYERCVYGFEHFVDAHCFIQDRKPGGSSEAVPFKLWPGQKQVVSLILRATYLAVLKARQLGLTWLVAAYVLWRAMFRYHELVIVISAKEDLAIEFLDRVKFMFDRLPVWMKPAVRVRNNTELSFGYETKDERGNVKIDGLNSTIKSVPSTPDAGQSKTISLLVMDETALNRYCKQIWGSAKPTLEHAHGQAIIISNPSKTMPGWSWTRDLCVSALAKLNEFVLAFLDWKCVPGRGDDFLEMQKRAGLDDEDISMQYPTTVQEALSSLGGSYFGNTIARFEQGRPGERGVLTLDETNGGMKFHPDPAGILEVWRRPERDWASRYAIGSDVSEGLGNTYSVAYVYDRFLNEFVARLRSNRIPADVWAKELIKLGVYYNYAMIGPERNGAGITTVIHLQGEMYPNLFYRQRPGKIHGEFVKEYGWLETEEAKQILADELKRHYREIFQTVPCRCLLEESATFIRHENGRLAHEDGKMDDCVIAAGIALQVSIAMPTVANVAPKPAVPMHVKRLDDLENGVCDDDFEDWMHSQSPRRGATINDPNLG